MGSKLKNLAVRVVSALLLGVVVLGAIYSSYWGFGALLLVITLGSVREFYRMSSQKGIAAQSVVGYSAATAIVGMGFDLFYNSGANCISFVLFLLLIIPVVFLAELFKGGDKAFLNIGTTLLALAYVAAPMAIMAGIPLLITGGEWDSMVMILYMFVIWCNDSFAYLVGVTFGRHKLYEGISPKKSWEGLFGGIAGAILMSIVAAYVLDADVAMWIGIGVITSVAGCLGDLVESMFKRDCGVKDSGTILPGHGGWLDRFDSLIFSAPFVLVYLIIFNNL